MQQDYFSHYYYLPVSELHRASYLVGNRASEQTLLPKNAVLLFYRVVRYVALQPPSFGLRSLLTGVKSTEPHIGVVALMKGGFTRNQSQTSRGPGLLLEICVRCAIWGLFFIGGKKKKKSSREPTVGPGENVSLLLVALCNVKQTLSFDLTYRLGGEPLWLFAYNEVKDDATSA